MKKDEETFLDFEQNGAWNNRVYQIATVHIYQNDEYYHNLWIGFRLKESEFLHVATELNGYTNYFISVKFKRYR